MAKLEEDKNAQQEFVEAIRSMLPRAAAHADDGSDEFFKRDGEAAGIRDLWGGVKAGARRLLNFTTYYKMKERAGLVGTR